MGRVVIATLTGTKRVRFASLTLQQGSEQGAVALKQLVCIFHRDQVGRGAGADSCKRIEGFDLAARAQPISEDGKANGRRPSDTVEAVDEERTAGVSSSELKSGSDIVRQGGGVAKDFAVCVLEGEDQVGRRG
ncbi:hypothetical protein DVR09_15445 (plasmid) [Erythrobacter aureus]|uniref:Uncharacterized protein n=1 Tax=Erythrobacter aureus TaxID=2182384 RepID=A0A345YIU5_9SPHN|nr:hypothetical protein DVR09_15445 [Erythrobacter aureus]